MAELNWREQEPLRARQASGQAAALIDGEEVGHDIEVTMPQTLSGVGVTGCMQWEEN